MSTLQTNLSQLAAQFTSQVIDAIRGASLEELLGGGREDANGRHNRTSKTSVSRQAVSRQAAAPRTTKATGRLARRSADDIAKALDQVVTLVKKSKEGLRAEQIRSSLGMEAKEMPRILKAGLDAKVLKSRGQKRATTYFAK